MPNPLTKRRGSNILFSLCGHGGTGRRVRLRGVWITPSEFKSRWPHQRRRKATVAKPRALVRGFCIHACAKPHRKYFRRGPRRSSSRRENARRSPCSSSLRNYRTAHSFLLSVCGFRRISARRQSQNLAHISARFLHPYNME